MSDEIETPEAQAFVVEAARSARLAQLHASYADAKAQADAAAEALKAITDAIKLELTQAAPAGETRIELRGENGPPLRLTHSESWRLDSRKLKKDYPQIWVTFAKKSESWTLRAGGGGQ